MTDASQLIPNPTAITSDLNFSMKPIATRCRSYRASILPTNKSQFNQQDTAIIYVPGGRASTYLDCGQTYLRLTIKNTDASSTNSLYLDGGAHCIINRIDIFHGSNLLETIQSYNILANYIYDVQASASQRAGLSNTYGFGYTGDRNGTALIGGNQMTFCIPLFSGVLGVLNDKALPLGFLRDDVRMEITFEKNDLAVYSASSTSIYQVVDLQLELTIMELSDEGESMVRQHADPNAPIFMHCSTWKHFTSNLPSGSSGQYATLVPARYASLKQLALAPRRASDQILGSYSIGSRVNPNISQYNWRIGSNLIPSKPVVLINSQNTGAFAEAYTEMLRAFHSLHSVSNSSCLGATEYNVCDTKPAGTTVTTATAAGDTAYRNGFVIAQECESFANRNDVLVSGMNTLNNQVFFECQVNSATSESYTLDFFAWHDMIMVLENGVITVRM